MTVPMATALKRSLDLCMAQVDEEQRFRIEMLDLSSKTCDEAKAVLVANGRQREAALKAALADEQERSRKAAEEIATEQFMHPLWAAGGVLGGILLGVLVGGGVVLYYTVVAAPAP